MKLGEKKKEARHRGRRIEKGLRNQTMLNPDMKKPLSVTVGRHTVGERRLGTPTAKAKEGPKIGRPPWRPTGKHSAIFSPEAKTISGRN